MVRIFTILGFILLLSLPTKAKVFDFVVDPDGNGDYTTIQDVINAVTSNNSNRTLIFVRNGSYNEKVNIPATKINVSLIGESRDGVVIAWADYAGLNSMSSAESYTLIVEGKDFYMENITVQNTAGNVGQALAIRTVGDRGVYKNCRFLGFQDTYYAHKARQYNYQCFVEGATDFIYGDATAVFDQCIINCVKGGSYITAPADTKLVTNFSSGNKFYHGLQMRECEVTANVDVPVNSYYLGRPWQPNATSVFIQSKLGNHIKPEGWSTWSDNNHLSGYYAEYHNTDLNGDTIDVSQRVSWSNQITDAWYTNFYKLDFFFKKDGTVWEAKKMTKALKTPENVHLDGELIRWDAVEQAIGYVVFSDNNFLEITVEPSLSTTGLNIDKIEVKSVRENGVLSNPSNQNLLVGNKILIADEGPQIWTHDKTIYASENIQLTVYNLSGVVVKTSQWVSQQNLSELPIGYYILKAENIQGKTIVQKFML